MLTGRVLRVVTFRSSGAVPEMMKLTVDGRDIPCVTWRAEPSPDKRLLWRFITADHKVWRVCMVNLPPARNLVNTDADLVEVISLLRPVADWVSNVHGAKTAKAASKEVEGFLGNLLRQYDEHFPGTIRALPNVSGVCPIQARTVGRGRSAAIRLEIRTIPASVLKAVHGMVMAEGGDAHSIHPSCHSLMRQVEESLIESQLLPDAYLSGELELLVKRLALRPDRLTPQHRPIVSEHVVVGEYYRHTRIGPEVPPDKREDSYGFQEFLRRIDFIVVHHWPDFTVTLPAYWVDTTPVAMNADDAQALPALDASQEPKPFVLFSQGFSVVELPFAGFEPLKLKKGKRTTALRRLFEKWEVAPDRWNDWLELRGNSGITGEDGGPLRFFEDRGTGREGIKRVLHSIVEENKTPTQTGTVYKTRLSSSYRYAMKS